MPFLRPLAILPLFVWAMACLPQQALAQADETGLPNAQIQDLAGTELNAATLSNDGKPMVVSFWATWCKPCILELSTIHEEYTLWQEETGVKLVAISIDDSRNAAKVGPFVNGKAWDFEVYLDPNSELKRAMNVLNVPHTFLYDGEGRLVYQHTSYKPGDEAELYQRLLELAEAQ